MTVDVPPAEELDPPGDPESVARTICLRLLERQARTRAELEAALRKKGVPDDAGQRVLDRFTEVGLINDSALADGFRLPGAGLIGPLQEARPTSLPKPTLRRSPGRSPCAC